MQIQISRRQNIFVSCGTRHAAMLQQFLEMEREKIEGKYRKEGDFAALYEEPSDENEEKPLYFQDTNQLLEVYTQLEEQNLFLIQNLQETEQSLEEVQTKFDDAKKALLCFLFKNKVFFLIKLFCINSCYNKDSNT